MSYMFKGATSFNQPLGSWSFVINQFQVNMVDISQGSGCDGCASCLDEPGCICTCPNPTPSPTISPTVSPTPTPTAPTPAPTPPPTPSPRALLFAFMTSDAGMNALLLGSEVVVFQAFEHAIARIAKID